MADEIIFWNESNSTADDPIRREKVLEFFKNFVED
jgi:hypothetical protein